MRREKKFEAVFKMQFQVTQVPPQEAAGLMISLIPVDAEKPTARLEEAKIVEGTCTWENPVYETVKLVQEIKTGRIREKFYYLIVSTGSSKSGFLGEVSVDFADLAKTTKPRNLTLLLQTSKSGAILHVTVQRMPEDQDSRSTEDGEFLDAETIDRYSDRNGGRHSTESGASSEASCCERCGSSEDAESENNQMKMLERKVEVSEKEVESLKHQVIKESKKGQQLSELIAHLQEERDAIKTKCEQLKSDFASAVQKETESMKISLEGIKKELQCERHLNDKLKLQLQKTEDSNSEYILALRDLNKNMDQKNMEISQLLSKIPLESEKMDPDEEILLKQTIENLYSEIEVHKKEKEDILMDVKRLTTDGENLEIECKQMYSTLQQNQMEKMEMEQNYAESLATVKQLEFRVETLEEDIKKQQLQYSASLTVNEELEIQVENPAATRPPPPPPSLAPAADASPRLDIHPNSNPDYPLLIAINTENIDLSQMGSWESNEQSLLRYHELTQKQGFPSPQRHAQCHCTLVFPLQLSQLNIRSRHSPPPPVAAIKIFTTTKMPLVD